MPHTYVAVDVETTGLDPYADEIIEVATVIFNMDEVIDEWSSLVDPGRELPEFIVSLTGITPDMVEGAPSIFSLRGSIRRMVGDHVIVGHNVQFDMGFLEQAHIGVGQQRLDTATLASILVPGAGHYRLGEIAQYVGVHEDPGGVTHRALADARRTARLLQVLFTRAAELAYWQLEEIVEAGRQIQWPETLFFEEALRQRGRSAFGERERPSRLFQAPKIEGHALAPLDDPEPLDVTVIADLLRPGSNFSRTFPAYEFRPQQMKMVEAVAEAFNRGEHLIVEAGTGTGKSVGYLLPAAFWSHQNDRCVVVSTNTINLQDQLINKDLPQLQALLPFPLRATVLKGKRNYLCTRLFRQLRHSGPANADEMILLSRLLVWLPRTKSGDVNEISLRGNGEQMAWARLNADNDTCRGDTCAEERCPLHVARRRAERAHVVVVNHALLLADVRAGNRVLPPYRDLVIDEAHHLEAAVTDGLSFRADRRFMETSLEEITRPRAGLVGDLQSQVRAALPAALSQELDGFADKLRREAVLAVDRLALFFETLEHFLEDYTDQRSPYALQVRLVPAIRTQPGWDDVEIAWANLAGYLKGLGEGLETLAGGLDDILEAYDVEDGEELQAAVMSLGRLLQETLKEMNAIISEPGNEQIYWAEVYRNRTSLHAAPLHVGPLVEAHIFAEKENVVLTSATLRTAGRGGYGDVDFAYLRDRLYAQHAGELAVGSPFDYRKNALLYLVSDMPEPNQPGYQRYVNEAVSTVARTLGGRTMVLFTSYGQLRTTAQEIGPALKEANITLLAQGQGASRQHLLEQFKQTGSRSVLLGTRSFWEGVDVPGAALQAVIIARLPFDVPSDPIFAARAETFENSFFEYSIPEAVLRFRQGFGRLIRRRDDEGVVIVLDKRVLTRRYGQSFIDALPGCTVIRQRHERLEELLVRWFNRDKEA